MSNQKLAKYIKRQLDRGISKERIKEALFKKGWEEKIVEKAFANIESTNNFSSEEKSVFFNPQQSGQQVESEKNYLK